MSWTGASTTTGLRCQWKWNFKFLRRRFSLWVQRLERVMKRLDQVAAPLLKWLDQVMTPHMRQEALQPLKLTMLQASLRPMVEVTMVQVMRELSRVRLCGVPGPIARGGAVARGFRRLRGGACLFATLVPRRPASEKSSSRLRSKRNVGSQIAKRSPCVCHAFAVGLPWVCHAFAMGLPSWVCLGFAVPPVGLPWVCHHVMTCH